MPVTIETIRLARDFIEMLPGWASKPSYITADPDGSVEMVRLAPRIASYLCADCS